MHAREATHMQHVPAVQVRHARSNVQQQRQHLGLQRPKEDETPAEALVNRNFLLRQPANADSHR
jgi:hypothetical protein